MTLDLEPTLDQDIEVCPNCGGEMWPGMRVYRRGAYVVADFCRNCTWAIWDGGAGYNEFVDDALSDLPEQERDREREA